MGISTRSRTQAIVGGLVFAFLGLFALRALAGHEPVFGTPNIILLSFAAASTLFFLVLWLWAKPH